MSGNQCTQRDQAWAGEGEFAVTLKISIKRHCVTQQQTDRNQGTGASAKHGPHLDFTHSFNLWWFIF